jgi:hypothetical protein
LAKDCKSYNGNMYGKLTVLREYSLKSPEGKVKKFFDCACACGNLTSPSKESVLGGKSLSCGCSKKECRSINVGDIFNSLTLSAPPFKVLYKKGFYGTFACTCGKSKDILISNVKAGTTLSCGCIKAINKKIIGPTSLAVPREVWGSICKRYLDGESTPSLSAEYGVSACTIIRVLKVSDVATRAKVDRHMVGDNHIDREKFSDHGCADTAYYYGLLLADGCINGNGVAFSLKAEDGYMVRSIHSWLNAQTKVTERSRLDKRTGKIYHSTSMTFADNVIAGSLRVLGMRERKSCEEILPDVFKFNRHFWRGMIDGDGHISTTSNLINLCGSKEICQGFLDFAESIGVIGSQSITKVNTLHRINLTGFDKCKKILDVLYEDSILYLDRKHKNYLKRYYKLDGA